MNAILKKILLVIIISTFVASCSRDHGLLGDGNDGANTPEKILINIGIDAAAGNNNNTNSLTAEDLNSVPGVSDATSENEAAYLAAIAANEGPFSSPATASEVQGMVTAVNNAQDVLKNIGVDAANGNNANTGSLSADDLNGIVGVSDATSANEAAYLAAIAANEGPFSSPANASEVQAMVTAVNNAQEILKNIGVDAANGNNANTGSLSADDLNGIVGVSDATSANEAAYQAAIAANEGPFSSPATASEVQAMVSAVNDVQALFAAIGTDANNGNNNNTSSLTAADLNSIPGVSGAVAMPSNEAAYQAAIAANEGPFSNPATASEIQAMITAVNNAQALLAAIGTDANNGNNNNTGSLTAGALNNIPGVSGATTANEAAYQAAIAANEGPFSSPATAAEVQAMVTAVNNAQDVLKNIGIDAANGNNANTGSLSADDLNDVIGVSGATSANEAAYQAAVAANEGPFSSPATASEVQAMVTNVNDAQSLLAEIGIDENDGATTTTNATAAELNGIIGVTGAVAANETAYQDYISANEGNFSSPATAAEVQAMITSVNTAQSLLTEIGIDENDGATTTTNATAAELNGIIGVSGAIAANETAYQDYISANEGNFSSPATAAEVQAMITSVNTAQSLLAEIGIDENDGATTTTNATAAELNGIIGVSGAIAANETAYQDYISANEGNFSSPATAAEVQAMITSVNTAQSLLAEIGIDENDGATTTTNATAAELNGIIGVSGAVAANETAYQDYISANENNFSSPATAAEVQAMITSVNTAQSLLADIGTDAANGNNANTSSVTAVDLNNIVGVSGATSANEAAYQAAIAANDGPFSSPATASEVQAMVTDINDAQSLLAEIGIDENDGATTTTNATAAELNGIIGVTGAVAANETAYQDYISANENNFSSPAATAAEVQAMITAVNNAQSLLAEIGIDENDGTTTTTNATAAELNGIIGVSGAIAANETAYQDYISANEGNFSSPATAAEVQAMITSVNTAQSLLADIGTDAANGNNANTSSVTAVDLNNIVGVSGATSANEAAYQAAIAANDGPFSSPATASEVQAMVTDINDAQSLLAEIGTDENDGATTTTNATAAELNGIIGVTGAVAANETAYQDYISANEGNFSSPATAAEVQAMITSVNNAQSLLAEIGIDENDGATTTTNATAAELNGIIGVTGAVAANETAYQDYISANENNFSSPATAAEVQAMITSVNTAQSLLADIGTDAANGNNANTSSVTAVDLNNIVGVSGATSANEAAYQAAIAANDGPFSSPATASEVQAMVTDINDAQSLLAEIGIDENDGATTTTNATAAELNGIIGVTGAVAANETAYQDYISANEGNFSSPATAAEVQAMITSVNNAQSLLTEIGIDENDGATTTTNATAAELNGIIGVSGAVAANETAYQDYISANEGNFSSPATAAEVQAMITSVNTAQGLLAEIGIDENDGATTTTNATAAELNGIIGVSGAVAANETAYQDYISANEGNFSSPATAAEVQAMITSVNTAQSLLTEIGIDENDGATTTTNATAAELNGIIGVSGAIAANETAYQDYISANEGNFSSPATAAEVQAMITAVNNAQSLLAEIGTDEDDGGATSTNASAAQLNGIIGVTGATAANESAYQDYIDANGDNFSSPATASEVQAMITSLNNGQTLLAAIGIDENDGATTTTNATAAELNGIIGVSGAIAANETAYQDYISANEGNFSSPATAAEVQAMITSVNTAQSLLAEIGIDENDGATTTTNATAAELNGIIGVSGAIAANETAYQDYISANEGNFSSPATAAEVQAMITSVNTAQSLLTEIGIDENDGATTTTNATAAELNGIIGVSGAIAANETAYQDYISANEGNFSSPATAAEVQAMITSVNTAQSLLTEIGIDENDGATTTTNATAAELNGIIGVSGAVAANETAYQDYISANEGNFSSPATAAEVQAMITSVNTAQSLLAEIGIDENDGATTTTNATAAELNGIIGVSGAIAANETAYQDYISANEGNFSSPATAAEVQAMITSVNNAQSLLTEIGIDENDGATTTTNATAAELNGIIGVTGAVAANETAYQDYISANEGNFSSPATAAEVQAMITSVNTAQSLLAEIGIDENDGATTTTNATAAELNGIIGVSGAIAANETAYQDYISANEGNFSSPATAAEVQAMITSVNNAQSLLTEIGIDENDGATTTTNATAAELNGIIGVTGAVAANETAYQDYISANEGNFSSPATAAEVQAMITSVNTAQSLLAEIGIDENDGATTTTNATAAELNGIIGVSGAIAANETAYQDYISANEGNFSSPATAAEVQAMITSVNTAQTLLAAIGTDENDGGATSTNASAAQLNGIIGVSGAIAANETAYQDYISANEGNFSSPATAAEVQAMITSVNTAQSLLTEIGIDENDGATTTTNATAAELNGIIGVTGAVAANETAYQDYISANEGNFSSPATAAEVQAMITSVNTAQTLLAAIGTDENDGGATSTNASAAQLNGIIGVTGAVAANETAYQDYISANEGNFSSPATAAEVQAMITSVNTAQTLLAAIGTDENDGGATSTNASAAQLNGIIGVTGAVAANETAYQDYISANEGNFSSPATAAEVQAMITSVNTAQSLLTEIGIDENDGATTTTNATAAELNGIIGVTGAVAANETAYQDYISANEGNFSSPATAAEVQAMITSVNTAQTLLAAIGTDENDGGATSTNASAAQLNGIIGVSGAIAANETAYQDYINANEGNFSSPATASEVQAMITSVNAAQTLLATIGLDEDNTSNSTTNANAAAFNNIIGVTGAVAANESAYQAYIDANEGNFSSPATASEVQAMITSVNAAQTLLTTIGLDEDNTSNSTTNANAAAFNNIIGVTGAVAANESAYQAYIDANEGNFSSPATASEVQAMITSVNASQTILANIGTDETNGNNTLTSSLTAAQLNGIIGVSGAVAANETAYQEYIAANNGAFSSPATASEVQAMIDEIVIITAITVQSSPVVQDSVYSLIAGALGFGSKPVDLVTPANNGVSDNLMKVTGIHFGAVQGTGTLIINGVTATIALDGSGDPIWNDTEIQFYVPPHTMSSAGATDDVTLVVTNGTTGVSSLHTLNFAYHDCDVCRIVNGCPF